MLVEWREEALLVAHNVRQRANAYGISTTHFAPLWVLGNAQARSVVCGARTRERLEGYLGALKHSLTDNGECVVDSIITSGANSPTKFVDLQLLVTDRFGRIDLRVHKQ